MGGDGDNNRLVRVEGSQALVVIHYHLTFCLHEDVLGFVTSCAMVWGLGPRPRRRWLPQNLTGRRYIINSRKSGVVTKIEKAPQGLTPKHESQPLE